MRAQRRLTAIVDELGPLSVLAQAFLSGSRRRSIRRGTITAASIATFITALTVALVVNYDNNNFNRANTEQVANYTRGNTDITIGAADPYAGLQLAAHSGGNESAVNADIIDSALADPVPDDAFTLPIEVTRFATKPIGANVLVTAQGDSTWERPTGDTSSRSATKVAAVAHPSPQPSSNGVWSVRYSGSSGVVDVLQGANLYRHLVSPSPPAAVDISPDGRFVGVATGAAVRVFSLNAGDQRILLRGAPQAITDISWTADSSRVWAASGHFVLSWSIRDGHVLMDRPAAWFQAILPSSVQDDIWVVSRTGSLTQLSVLSGQVNRSINVPDEVLSASGDQLGRRAVIIGRQHDWIVDLESGAALPFQVNNCQASRPGFAEQANVIIIPCLGGPVVIRSALTGRPIAEVGVGATGADSVNVSSTTGRVFVGGRSGEIYELSANLSSARWLQTTQCRSGILSIAIAPSDTTLVPVGVGAGMYGCILEGVRGGTGGVLQGAGWSWNAVAESLRSSNYAQTVTFFARGRGFAVGYSDGSIVLRPTKNIAPEMIIRSVAGAIRDEYVVLGGRDLVVATRDGIIEALPLPTATLTNRALAGLAGTRLLRAQALGLTKVRA